MDKFKQEYTFSPERVKTKRYDQILVKSNKENDESLFERLYKVH